MQAIKFTCPHCQAVLRSPKPLPDGVQIKCVTCHKPFKVQSGMQSQSTAASYDGGDNKLPADTLDFLSQAAGTSGPRPLGSVRRPRRGVGRVVLVCAFLVLLLGGAAAAVLFLLKDSPASTAKAKKTPATTQVASGQPKPAVAVPERPKDKTPSRDTPREPVKPVVEKGGRSASGTKPGAADPVDPVMPRKKEKKQAPLDPAKINEAIDRGVRYLKTHIDPSGNWKPDEKFNPVGHAALPALALLECNVPAGDPAIQAAARYVRKHALGTEETYCLGCVILFLDRLDDPADRPLIRHLALRLAAGQTLSGAWGYKCPELNLAERGQLEMFLEQHRPKIELLMAIVADPEAPKRPRRGGEKPPPPETKPAPTPRPARLSPRMAELPVVKLQKQRDPEQFQLKRGDNSNTQFALLGLWAARRHGIAADLSLKLAAEHFRRTQNGNGGWGYATGTPTKNTMTSVGLLSLALGHGAAAEVFQAAAAKNGKPPRPPINDPHIKEALDSLASYLDGGEKELRGLESRLDLYLFWAIERVGVLYQCDTIGKTDWYRWAAQDILKRQAADGGWEDHYHPAIDTSFALLVLKRSNLVRGLTESLHGYLDPSLRRGL